MYMVWCCFIPSREGLKQKKLVNMLLVWVGCGFVGTELCLFLACRPFVQYWAVPVSEGQPKPHRKLLSLLKRSFSPVCHVPALRDYRINFQYKLRHHDVDHRNTVIVFSSLTIATESSSPDNLRDGCFRYCGGNPYQDLLLGAKPDHICLSKLVFPRGIRVHIRRESPCPMVAAAGYIPPTEKLGFWKQKVEWVSKSVLFIKWRQ